MKTDEKELLLKDLSARVPYGVKFVIDNGLNNVRTLTGIGEDIPHEDWQMCAFARGISAIPIEYIKPYLFPLSSMTDEQKKEFLSVARYETREEDCGRHTETYYYDMVGHEHTMYPNYDAIDWLNKNHFDYRGLISKELAIDATGLNIY